MPPGKQSTPGLVFRTLRLLRRERPERLFIQCPSVVLGLLAALVKPLFGFRLFADLHNEAVQPFIHASPTYLRALRLIHRSADLSLVSNTGLESAVRMNSGRPFVLPDRLPSLVAPCRAADSRSERRVAFVCTFAPDEPWRQVVSAASDLPFGTRLFITGRAPADAVRLAPGRVTFTGYLPDEEYVSLLACSAAVMDLTEMENCLVCGGYEAAALSRPLVTSDTAALRRFFPRGAVFTRHDPQSLAHAMGFALANHESLRSQMAALAPELAADWQLRARDLVSRIEEC